MSACRLITVQNAQRKQRLAIGPFQLFAERALRLCLELKPAGASVLRDLEEVSVVLVSDSKMAALHKEFMDITGPTDVLTFQHGEIFIGIGTAGENAAAFGTSTEHEIQLYIVHGLLHLHGFDDITPAEASRMDATQRRILAAASAG